MFPMRTGPPDSSDWPLPCRSVTPIAPSTVSVALDFMDRLSPMLRTLRSTMVTAFLTVGLLGCRKADAAAAAQQAPGEEKQDWETEPRLWYPRPILIPKSTPAVVGHDSVRAGTPHDSSGRSLSFDSGVSVGAESASGDSTGRARTLSDSARADSATPLPIALTGSKPAAPPARPVKRLFNLPPSDSARWPVRTADPLPGSIIPEHRIVAFYGNPLSKKMGILGELPSEQMLSRLDEVATEWAATDSGQKVLPALHLIAIVAQGYPGPARKYRLQMPDSIIQRLASVVEERGWLLFLDMQVGVSTVEDELKVLIPYLKRPYVHLALDPEFAMKDGKRPGTDWMGRMDASEVNHAIDVLAKIVEEEHLPPKVLVVHRFTRNMLTNASQIRLDPRVQVVIDMDGWGTPGSKMGAYRWFVVRHPVQYTGFKLFYRNDKPMMTPQQVLELYPKPMYIQYQ
jgi:hypothetical protein